MRFDLVLVGYRPAHTAAAIDFCNRAFREPCVQRRVLVLNRPDLRTSLAADALQGWETVDGTNAFGEFSGWQEGLERLGRGPRGVVFANDSLTVQRKFTSARRIALVKALGGARPTSFIGFRDRGEGDLAVNGLPLDSWVRTYCFGLSPQALERLGYRICDEAVARACVNGGLDEATFFSNLSPDLEMRLRHNLFGGGWYASEPLSAGTVARLSFKARCIALEKWLSARCLALGIESVDPFERYPLARLVDRAQTLISKGALAGLARTMPRAAKRASLAVDP